MKGSRSREKVPGRFGTTSCGLRCAQAEGRSAVFDRALCAGVPAPRLTAVAGKLSEPRRLPRYCGGSCEPQKHLRVGEEWAGTDNLRTHSFASAQFDAPCSKQLNLLHCNHGLRGR